MPNNVFDFRDRPPARTRNKSLLDVVKESGAVDAAFGRSAAVPEDPLDAVLGGVADAFAAQRPSTSLEGRLREAARTKEETPTEPVDAKAAARERLENLSADELSALEEVYSEKLDAELTEAAALADATGFDEVDTWVTDVSDYLLEEGDEN